MKSLAQCLQFGYCPPPSNSWTINISWLYIALNRTPNTDCYWVGAVPNIQLYKLPVKACMGISPEAAERILEETVTILPKSLNRISSNPKLDKPKLQTLKPQTPTLVSKAPRRLTGPSLGFRVCQMSYNRNS